jgi:hypothetical protein
MEGENAAPACRLDESGLRDQLERYRQISGHVEAIEREPGRVVVRFGAALLDGRLEQALDVERNCCPFIGADYDAETRRLVLTVDEAAQNPALDLLFEALSPRRRRHG